MEGDSASESSASETSREVSPFRFRFRPRDLDVFDATLLGEIEHCMRATAEGENTFHCQIRLW